MLLGGVVIVLLVIVLAAKLQSDRNEAILAESYGIEENATEGSETSVDAVSKEDTETDAEKEELADANKEETTKTDEQTETDTQSEQNAEAGTSDSENASGEGEADANAAEPSDADKAPTTDTANPMNADGMTWTTFDGVTMGSVNGGTYGSLYTADQIRALDGTKQGYGQGVNVDENNRPVGAIWLQNDYGKYGAVYIAEQSSQIYMTLDEGYENGYTATILDKFKEKNCSAVFFVTMDYVKKNPDLVKRMIDEGHVVGNHSVNHKSMPTLSLEEASSEITELHQYMLDNYGYEMYLFRPPMGEFSEQTLALAQSLGYRTMLWSYAYRDYDTENQPDVSEALQKVTAAKHGGAVYLLHAVSSTNTAIMGDVIDNFRASGYTVGAFPR